MCGVNFSPFAAQYVAQENARRNSAQFPLAAETILKSTYMDDSIDSVPDEEVAVQLHQELSTVWSKAGMHARKWLSNSNFVMKNIPTEDRAQKVDLDKSDLPSTKTLGMLWNAKEDIFTYRYNANMDYNKLAKRIFLKKIASLFDPLGFLAPYVVRAKMLLQQIGTSGIDWDNTLRDQDNVEVVKWFEELDRLASIRVP